MAIIFNGTTIPENVANALSFNGVNITDVFFNGVQVWDQLLFNALWSGDSLVDVSGQIVGIDTSGSLHRQIVYQFGGPAAATPWGTVNSNGTFDTETLSVTVNKFPSGTITFGMKTTANSIGIYSAVTASTSASWSVATGFTGESRFSGDAEASYETSGGLLRYNSGTGLGNWISLT